MKIDKVTITGADDTVSVIDLIELSKFYPFVEWGILFSHNYNRSRYPSPNWLSVLATYKKIYDINLSAHYCGKYCREIFENNNFDYFSTARNIGASRVQLNYKFSNEYDFKILNDFLNDNNYFNIILQYNENNKTVIDNLLDYEMCELYDILYDSSGGNNIKIKDIQQPFEKNYTGYAGGININNIDNIINKIEQINMDKKVWIDMESGIRTNDKFDLNKVKIILDKVKKHIDETN